MRIFIIALAVLYWAGASLATSMVIGPAECPLEADLPPIAAPDAEAPDLNPWRQSADEVNPIIDVNVGEQPQTGELFARFRADPETGETLSRREKACGE